ncbi:MAG TPA: hypothetical protein VF424_16415 [Vicinamibacterales bacterium]
MKRDDFEGKTEMAEMPIGVLEVVSRSDSVSLDPSHPARQWVPTGENLGHHLQVVDSKRPKSETHSISRTAVGS